VRGESSFYIILFELLPNMISLTVAIFLGAALYAVLAAAGLQFIGLGNADEISWGTMLYWGENNEALMTGSPLWIMIPGACIALLGASVALHQLRRGRTRQPIAARGEEETWPPRPPCLKSRTWWSTTTPARPAPVPSMG